MNYIFIGVSIVLTVMSAFQFVKSCITVCSEKANCAAKLKRLFEQTVAISSIEHEKDCCSL